MKNVDLWTPTKFKSRGGYLRPSADPTQVGVGSRFTTGIVAKVYQSLLTEHASGAILDLGCGAVPLYGVYRDLVTETTCIDWSESPHTTCHLDHEFDLNAPLPLPAGRFDTILLTDVLEHIAKPDVLWREISRLLAPNGKLILTVPFLYWLHEVPHDHFRYTEHRLSLYCEENGLRLLTLEPYGGAPEVIFDIVAKHLAISRALSAIHLAVARSFSGSWVGRRLSDKTARRFPLGYYLVAQKGPAG